MWCRFMCTDPLSGYVYISVTYVQPAAEAGQVVVINQPPRPQEIYVTTRQLQPNTAATAVQMVQLVPGTEQVYSTPAPQQQNNASVDVYVFEAKTLNPTGRDFYDR